MISKALKDVTDLAGLAAQARSGQITLLLDGDKPAAFLASGRCSSAELTSALLATRPECSGEVRIERRKLGHQWPAMMRKVRDRNVVIVTEGRVLAGIVRDDGPVVMDTITLGSDTRGERDAAIVAGREIQLRRWHQVVARIVPPSRIAGFLPGWTVPEPEPLSHRRPVVGVKGEEKRRQVALRAELRGSRKAPRRMDDGDESEMVPETIDDVLW
jgi:hypothetical protein